MESKYIVLDEIKWYHISGIALGYIALKKNKYPILFYNISLGWVILYSSTKGILDV